MEKSIKICIAKPSDAEELLKIYEPYVLNTAISFETAVPSIEEFRKRIETTLKTYPYLTARYGGKIIGYAYNGPFVPRSAYSHCAQPSIYISSSERKNGVGRRLYEELERISILQNINTLYACIGLPNEENDEHLDSNSADFHKHMGYTEVGKFSKCGYKFGHWYDMIWMEKNILPQQNDPKEMIPFPELKLTDLS